MKRFGLMLLLAAGVFAAGLAQAEPALKVSGYILANYQYYLNDESKYAIADEGGDLVADGPIEFNQFELTRAYITFSGDWTDKFSTNVTTDIKTDSDGLRRLFLKYAYADLKNLWPDSKVRFGLQDPPWGSYIDSNYWRYRMVDQAFSNFWGVYPTYDFGLGIMGGVFDNRLLYHAAVLNGEGGGGIETDRFKQFTGRLTLDLGSAESVRIYPSVGYSYQNFNDDTEFVNQVFNAALGVDFWRVHLAGEYLDGNYTMAAGSLPLVKGVWPTGALDAIKAATDPEDLVDDEYQDINFAGGAVYADLQLADKFNLFGRYDIYVPNTDPDFDDRQEYFWTAGLCYHPFNNLWITLDYRAVGFGDEDLDDDGDDELEPYQVVYTHWKIAY